MLWKRLVLLCEIYKTDPLTLLVYLIKASYINIHMKSRLLQMILILLAVTGSLCAQQYGLKFDGNEVISEQRTSLLLGEKKKICTGNDFSVSFDFQLEPIDVNYFGYILRLIDENGRNFDILFNGGLRFVFGESPVITGFPEDSVGLFSKSNHLEIHFSQASSSIRIELNKIKSREIKVNNLSFSCFELYFGQCSRPGFRNKDVVSMNLRDVKISSNNKLQHFWKLNEIGGFTAYDSEGSDEGVVTHPNWILKDYTEWKKVYESHRKGIVTLTQKTGSADFILYENSGIYQISTEGDTEARKIKPGNFSISYGDAAIPFNSNEQYGIVRLNSREVFKPEKGGEIIPPAKKLTEFWHHNIFVYPQDTALVCIGGYGMFKFKNRFQKYSFAQKAWEDIELTGDLPNPRYLAGFGNTLDGVTSYYVGGYGSRSGDQLLNPRNYYDFFRIDWSKNAVKKLFTLPAKEEEPFVFASNLIINEETQSYYALIFNQLKFNTELQLIEGSLTKPEFKKLGKPIPISFHDVSTQVALYKIIPGQKLICSVINLETTGQTSQLELFEISTPPGAPAGPAKAENKGYWLIIPAILAVLFFVYIYVIRKRRTDKKDISLRSAPNSALVPAFDTAIHPSPRNDKPEIRLFGKFQVIKPDGTDLSKAFTPLIKEIFLYLLLNSLRYNKGLSSDKLDEIFWFDKTKASARNNRSVNLIKIKGLLADLGGIELDKKTGNWEISLNTSEIYIDYEDFLKITGTKAKPAKKEIDRLSQITGQGTFLSNLEYEWLDSFQSEVSNKVIDCFLAYSEGLSVSEHAEELIEIADKIFLFDPVDETAMTLRCKALHFLGKHSLAKQTYETFIKKYQDLFSENYGRNFTEILES